jgi:hypothetical protein
MTAPRYRRLPVASPNFLERPMIAWEMAAAIRPVRRPVDVVAGSAPTEQYSSESAAARSVAQAQLKPRLEPSLAICRLGQFRHMRRRRMAPAAEGIGRTKGAKGLHDNHGMLDPAQPRRRIHS